jgi:outer membrane protein X
MKKIIILLHVMMFTFFGSIQAQDIKRVGGQFLYGSKLNTVGIGAVGEISIAPKMIISPSFSYFFPKGEEFVKTSTWEGNANLNYLFINDDKLEFYGIGGINITAMSVQLDIPGLSSISSATSRFGLNVGAGVNLNIGMKFLPFAEIKYIIGESDRLVMGAGVKFNL